LEWFLYFCISLLFHALILIFLLLARSSKVEKNKTNVTWVAIPRATAHSSSGGSASISFDNSKDVERQRRIDKTNFKSANQVDHRSVSSTSKTVNSVRHSIVGNKVSVRSSASGGAGCKPNKEIIVPAATIGTAGVGAGGGVGTGSSVCGLRAYNGANGATGLISEIDGNFPFVWYLQQIQARITGNWGRVGLAQGRVQVYFRIMRSGSVDGVRIESPSGNTSFDQTALLAVLRSAPLPKLPDGFEASSLGVRFWFMYLGN
jgi:TonB family protein